ncbi:MAG TPA: hypothetical protein VJZ71_19535 [Phycisphaerae bacterium]|nr:hypothetical protein [Phycisphaerae bacterium]
MASLIPNRFLFKFEFPLLRCPKPPSIDGRADKWDRRYLLPPLHELEGKEPFGDVLMTWDDAGLYLAVSVGGKRRPLKCEPEHFKQSDCLRLMTDMRDTRDSRRASRFCQHFYFLPTGGGAKGREPVAAAAIVPRAMQNAPLASAGSIPIAADVRKDGYSFTAHLPAAILAGFDPTENPRIGLYYMLEDTELGQQWLTVGDDLNWWMDPSTWATAVLTE